MSAASYVHSLNPPISVARKPRVLLAEDDDEVRQGLELLFESQGYEVCSVGTGTALLSKLATSMILEQKTPAPDIIVTDIRMPGFNGLNIVESLRQSGCATPLVVMSAFGDSDVRRRVEELHNASFFDKPFEPEALLHCMQWFIEHQDNSR